jgi:hypothetical protein
MSIKFSHLINMNFVSKKMFKNYGLLLIVLGFSIYGPGCTKANECSSVSTVTNSDCSSQIPSVSTLPVSLNISYIDSYFFDQLSQSWMTITQGNLSGGLTGMTVPIYSNFLNLDTADALTAVAAATTQFQNQASYTATQYNNIPYIELVPQVGATYLYDYVKKDLNNNVLYEKQATVPIINGRVILPLINAVFDNEFYPTNPAAGSLFVNDITFAAQSTAQQGTEGNTVVFQTQFDIPPSGYTVNYAGDISNFTLPTRWQYYYNGTDGVANSNMHFFQLVNQKTTPEQIPLNVKFVFQTPPVLNIDETVFWELPFDYQTFENTQTILPSRGNRFYSQLTTLTSSASTNPAFQMNIQVNGVTVPLTGGNTIEVDDLPAGTPWNLDFFYNFNQNAKYTSTSGRAMLSPLKPICWEFTDATYNPIAEETAKATAIANGGYISICHPDADATVTIAPTDTTTTETDSWYDDFSYVEYNAFTQYLGHMYGVKSVRFYTSGCMQVYSQQEGTSAGSWTLESQGDAQCATAGSGTSSSTTTNNGWVYYTAEQTFTIFDNAATYQTDSALSSLLQQFSISPTITNYPYYRYNGLINEVNHIF